jgi:hypothetical protein
MEIPPSPLHRFYCIPKTPIVPFESRDTGHHVVVKGSVDGSALKLASIEMAK